MAFENYSYIGKGPIYAAKYGVSEGLLPIGNCSKLEFGVETDRKSQLDYTEAGGGEYAVVDRVSSVTVAITALDLSPDNLALALRGGKTDVTSAAVTDERHTGYVGALIPFDHLPDLSQTIVVVHDPDGTPATLTLDTDYELTRSGIVILSGGAVADGDVLGIDYTRSAQSIIEALVDAGAELKMVFDGLNEANNGAAVSVVVHRVKFSPTAGLGLIGDDFAELELTGTALLDPSITGTGISRFFKALVQTA